jgi:Glutamine amidotransferase domain
VSAFAGFVGDLSSSPDARRAVLAAMGAALAHRGADAAVHDDGELALVCRRSSRQPPLFSLSDGVPPGLLLSDAWTMSDLSATRLTWDREARRLVLARDPYASAPLYWYSAGNLLLFSSEIKGLLAHPAYRSEMAWSDGWDPIDARSTCLRAVQQLPRGGSLWRSADGLVLFDTARERVPRAAPDPFAALAATSVEALLQSSRPVAISTDGGLAPLAFLAASASKFKHALERLWIVDSSGPVGRATELARILSQALGRPVEGLGFDGTLPEVSLTSLERLVWLSEQPLLDADMTLRAEVFARLRAAAGSEVVMLSGLGAAPLLARDPRETRLERARVPLSIRPFLSERFAPPLDDLAQLEQRALADTRVAEAYGVTIVTPFVDPRFGLPDDVSAALWGAAEREWPAAACVALRALEPDDDQARRRVACTRHVAARVLTPFIETHCGGSDAMFSGYKLGAAARALDANAQSSVANRIVETIVTCVTSATFMRLFSRS